MTKKKITILAGDGIGPEIMAEGIKVLKAVEAKFGFSFELDYQDFGGAGIEKNGHPFAPKVQEAVSAADAVLLGAIGHPKYDDAAVRPEQGILQMREHLGVYLNIRPIKIYDALVGISPIKAERLAGTDMVIYRELLNGIYFGKPRERTADGENAIDTMVYSKTDVRKVVKAGFEVAMKRRKRLSCVDKANVLECSRLWREVVREVALDFPEVAVQYNYVDSAAMHMITNPSQFDVIVTGNLFGDILSDEASVLSGSIGMAPSACLGDKYAVYEPIHGSAPDIAGQNKGNPIGMILSVAMMLRHSFQQEEAALWIEEAVEQALATGARTADIAQEGEGVLGTIEMGRLITNYELK